MHKRAIALLFILCSIFALTVAQVTSKLVQQTLLPDQPVERELAGAQEHKYQIKLAAGQFLRVVVEQKSVDVALGLVSPAGKPRASRLIRNDRMPIRTTGRRLF